MTESLLAESSKRSRSLSPKGEEPAAKKQATENDTSIPGPTATEIESKDSAHAASGPKKSRNPRHRAWESRKAKGRDALPDRKRRDGSASPRPVKEGEEGEEDGEGKKRLPKKTAAILLGYCGTGYSGMQMYVPSRQWTIR